MSKKKTHEEFVEELKNINNNIEPLEKYISAFEKILCRCKICGHEWMAIPKELTGKRQRGCPKCAIERRNKMKTKTDEEFQNELLKVHKGSIIALESYKGANIKIKFRCMIDSNEWYATPSHILQGHGCPKCANNKKYTHEEYEKLLSELNPNIKMLSKYKSMKEKIKVQCIIDNYEWYSMPQKLVEKEKQRRCGCPKCSNSLQLSHEEFVDRLSIINDNIIVKSRYENNRSRILCECKLCGADFSMKASHLLDGHGCKHCNCSIGENNIKRFLDNNNIKYIGQKYFDGLKGVGNRLLSYDFYLPKHNLLIEFQGKQHKKPIKHFGGEKQFEIQQEHDRRKREYAESHGIKLLEIWYYNINEIENILIEALG